MSHSLLGVPAVEMLQQQPPAAYRTQSWEFLCMVAWPQSCFQGCQHKVRGVAQLVSLAELRGPFLSLMSWPVMGQVYVLVNASQTC